jgi:hypothetical protein
MKIFHLIYGNPGLLEDHLVAISMNNTSYSFLVTLNIKNRLLSVLKQPANVFLYFITTSSSDKGFVRVNADPPQVSWPPVRITKSHCHTSFLLHLDSLLLVLHVITISVFEVK